MFVIRSTFISVVVAALLALTSAAYAEAGTDITKVPSGVYQLDPNHTSITFKILHLGFSHYTGRFDKIDGTLNFDNTAPENSALDVTVYPNSVDTNNAKLEEELREDKWFNVIKYPTATFKSTKIERTGPTTGKVTGDFTMLGVTHTVVLDVTLIGGGDSLLLKKSVLGFSATGTVHRSDYGFTNFIPMVGDDVALEIEVEFDKVP